MSIFSVASRMPVGTFSVPFGLQNVIWNSIGKSTGYSLVGITHDWRVVVLGDAQLSFKYDSFPAQSFNTADRSEKRTLFEDIFGSSAFANDDSEPLQSISSTSWQVRKLEGNRHSELFDKPAYLMPGVDILFDPLVTSLLNSRISEVDSNISEAVEESEDVTMIDDTVQQPLFATRPTRVPNQGEMELFTQLFRTTAITSSYSFTLTFMIVLTSSITLEKPPVSSKVIGKMNGVHSLKFNGISSIGTTVPQRPPSDDINPHEVSTPEPSVAPSPIFKGKKRKKVSIEAVN